MHEPVGWMPSPRLRKVYSVAGWELWIILVGRIGHRTAIHIYYVPGTRLDITIYKIHAWSYISVVLKGIIHELNLPFKPFKTGRTIAANVSVIPGSVGPVHVYTPDWFFFLSLLTSDALYLPEKFNVLAPVTLLGAILPYTKNKFIMKNSQSKPWKTYTELCCVQNAVQ